MTKPTLKEILQHPAYSLIEGHLPTNTWPGRHELTIARTLGLLQAANVRNISIALYGPGGVAADFADKLPRGDESKFKGKLTNIILGKEVIENTLAILRRTGQQWASMKETRARDQPGARLATFEPLEWYNALSPLGIERFDVYEKYDQVIDAVNALGIKEIKTIKVDFDREMPPVTRKYTLSIGQRFLEYCLDRVVTSEYILNSTDSDNGWLVLTNPKNVEVDIPGFYRKGERVYNRNRFKAPGLDNEEVIASAKSVVTDHKQIEKELPHTLFPNAPEN